MIISESSSVGIDNDPLSPGVKDGELLLVPGKDNREKSHSLLSSSITRGNSEARSPQEVSQVYSDSARLRCAGVGWL